LYTIGQSPLSLVEGLQFFCLGVVLMVVLAGFGGFLPFAARMVPVSVLLLALAALHALILCLRPVRPGLEWEQLLPLPFIFYAWLHFQFISPASGSAALLLTVCVQAYAIYLIVFNSLADSRSAVWLMVVCQIVVVVAMLIGYMHFYLFPDWMPVPGRARVPEYVHGAAGFLSDPANLAPLFLVFLPFSILVAWTRRYSGPTRVLNGALACSLLVAFVLSTHQWGLAAVALVLLVIPFFLTREARVWRRLWGYGGLVLALVGVLAWYGTQDLSRRMRHLAEGRGDDLAAASIQTAMAQFGEHPLLGGGLGSFGAVWESHLPAPAQGASEYAVSAYADTLAELGMVGLLCLALPLGLLLLRGFLVWRAMPFFTFDRDTTERMRRMPLKPHLLRRIERESGRVPTAKVLLGAILPAMAGCLVYAGWDYFHKLPLYLFLIGALLATLAVASRNFTRTPATRWTGLATSLLPMLLLSWAAAFGVPRFQAQHMVYTAEERLSLYLQEPERVFADPGSLSLLEAEFRGAIGLNPRHADAWFGLAETRLAHLHAALLPPAQIAAQALPHFAEALRLAPRSWRAHFGMARARAMAGVPDREVEAHLRAAVQAAPHRAEPAALLAGLLLRRDPAAAEGRALLERALALDPTYEPALGTARRLQLGSADAALPLGLLAEQFELRIGSRQRVLGAGLPVPEPGMLPVRPGTRP